MMANTASHAMVQTVAGTITMKESAYRCSVSGWEKMAQDVAAVPTFYQTVPDPLFYL